MNIIEFLESTPLSEITREDLKFAKDMPKGVAISNPENDIGVCASFQIGSIFVWKTSTRWQIATLINHRFTNHRGFTSNLSDTIQFVLREGEEKRVSLTNGERLLLLKTVNKELRTEHDLGIPIKRLKTLYQLKKKLSNKETV